MGYFDDFQLLNVTKVRMYGSFDTKVLHTRCHYLGIIQGTVFVNGIAENRPFVYLTPRNIDTLSGWVSPPNAFRDNSSAVIPNSFPPRSGDGHNLR